MLAKACCICLLILGKRRRKKVKSSDNSSSISTAHMESIVARLMVYQHRDSTARNYLNIWRQFNKFVMCLDGKPKLWEDRTMLFLAHLIDEGTQSTTFKSYASAIKKTLIIDGYKWNDNLVLVRSLARACRIINDQLITRLPIHCRLLEIILFEVQRLYTSKKQWYLEFLYKSIFILSYYGLMRAGEVTCSPHVLKARNVHIATNRNKILLVLYTSKTHGKANRPQKIKITANNDEKSGAYVRRHFCPFTILCQYVQIRGNYHNDEDQFFCFQE